MSKRKIKICVLVPRGLKRNGRGGEWSDYVKGEFWIDSSGQSTYADQDIGDVGHETIAVDSMLDRDALVQGMIEHAQARIDELEAQDKRNIADEDELVELRAQVASLEDEGDNDELSSSYFFFNSTIPDEAGIAAAGGQEQWEDLNQDARMAYAKHQGAILVINLEFYAYKVSRETIDAIQTFILDEATQQADEVSDPDTEMCVEQVEPKKYACMPVQEFLTIKHPRDLWAHSS